MVAIFNNRRGNDEVFFDKLFFGIGGDCFFIAGTPPNVFSATQESRTWTDSSGKFTIEAELVSQQGDSVKLRKADGKTVTLPASKLSVADRDFLAQNSENPFAGGSDDAASDASAGSSAFKIGGNTTKVDGFARPVPVGDRSQEKKTTFDGVSTDWKVVPPNGVAALKNARPVPLFADSRIKRFAAIMKTTIVAPTATDSPFYVGFNVGSGDDAKSYVERCDVATGTGKIVEISVPAFNLTDVSPDGKFALGTCAVKNKFGLAVPSILALIPLDRFGENETLDAAATFYPFFDADAPQFSVPPEIMSAVWVDSENVLTTTREEAVLWNLPTGRSVYSVPAQISSVALDSTRSLGTFATPEKVVVFAPKTGDVLGALELPPDAAGNAGSDDAAAAGTQNELEKMTKRIATGAFFPTSVSFSPDGLKIAAATAKTLSIFETKTGAKVASFAIERPFNSAIGWANPDFVLVGSVLYDAAKGVPLCDYRGGASGIGGVAFANGRVWMIGTSGARALVGYELPHQAALDALKSLDLSKNFAFYPGVPVALRLEINGLLNEKETRDALEKNLAKQGIKIDAKSKVVLTARCVKLDEEVEADYAVDSSATGRPRLPFSILRDPSLGSVKLKVFAQSFDISANGKSLWNFEQKTTGPQNVKYDSEKTLEQTLLDANKPDVEFYRYFNLPKYVGKNGQGGSAIMQASLTPDGVR